MLWSSINFVVKEYAVNYHKVLKKCNLSLLARQSRALKSPQPISKKCIIKGKKKAWPKEYRGVTSIPHFWSWWSFFCDLAGVARRFHFQFETKKAALPSRGVVLKLTSYFVNDHMSGFGILFPYKHVTCSRGLFGLWPVFLSYWARWKGMKVSPLQSGSYISSHFSMPMRCISMGHPCSEAIKISALTTWPAIKWIENLFLKVHLALFVVEWMRIKHCCFDVWQA